MSVAITLDDGGTKIVEGPGWRQVTGPNKRHYEIVGYDGVKFRSMSGLPWCDDFSGAARWMAGSWVSSHMLELQRIEQQDIRGTVARGAEDELMHAADRGTAIHGYLEALDTGSAIDWAEIERTGATAWIAAADAYVASRGPVQQRWVEAVCFNPDQANAGRIDAIEQRDEGLVVIDNKSRTKRHDRRTKDAGQLGGYVDAITTGGFFDEQGRRHVYDMDDISHVEVVTLCPDGSYATHRIDVERAVELHRMRLPLADVGVTNTYQKAQGGHRDINADLQARLDALAPEAKSELATLWTRHGMPKIANVTNDEYAQAVKLFETVEPFRTVTTRVDVADNATVAALITRWRFMPADLADDVERHALAAGGGSLSATFVDEAQVAIWDEWIGLGEWGRDVRHDLITNVLGLDSDVIVAALGSWAEWTDRDVDLAAEINDAGDDINAEWVEKVAGGKRKAVDVAKAACAEWELPAPTKFADIADDIRVYAVTVAALQTAKQGA